jgi:predicted DNA-binding protein with PD1-like motif
MLEVVNSAIGSDSKIHVFRLHPEQDLKQELVRYTKKANIKAGCIYLCCRQYSASLLTFSRSKSTRFFLWKV